MHGKAIATLLLIIAGASAFFPCIGNGRTTFVRTIEVTGTGLINPLQRSALMATVAPHQTTEKEAYLDVNALPDSKRRLAEARVKIESNMAKDVMNVGNLRESVRDMEMESSQPQFWDNQDKAQALLLELNRVKAMVERVDSWGSDCEDVETLLDMANEDPAEARSLLLEAVMTLDRLDKDLDAFEIEKLLGGKYDKYGCTLCIQSGAGGTEAQDWAGMLFRMYKRFAERKGYKTTIVEVMTADFGIKSCEMKIEGPFAYGYLGGEKGTHRLVRISPFNAQGKRQTSFAGVETWPILEESEIEDMVLLDKVRVRSGVLVVFVLAGCICIQPFSTLHHVPSH